MNIDKLLLVVVAMSFPLLSIADDSGKCGDNVTWYYSESTETLTISGSGEMVDDPAFDGASSMPWARYIDYYNTGIPTIKTIIINEGVTHIGAGAFAACPVITITIPESITSIGQDAFYLCRYLTSVSIPNSVTSIDNAVFRKCSSLTSVTIPICLKSIGIGAFSGCSSLTSINLPNSVTSIGQSAFSGCGSLTSINIPNSVTSIGQSAFSGCGSLTSINIPNSVTSIGEAAFSGCNSISTASLDCHEIGTWLSGLSSINTVVIGDNVSIIDESAFFNCANLETVSIGKNVTSIGYSAFSRCGKLSIVKSYIDNPFWIDASVFEYSLSGTTTLCVPKDTKSLYRNTFCWNQIPSITEMENAGDDPIGEKCSTPTIEYKNGKLYYSCETIGADFVTTITDTDIDTHNGNEVELSVAYQISVYAKAEGYDDSDMVYATLCWIEDDDTQITTMNSNIKSKSILIQCNNGTLSIIGAEEGSLIQVFNKSGQQVACQNASLGITTINTRMRAGDIALVKVKNKIIKVIIQ